MDRSHLESNDTSRARLARLLDRLTDADLGRVVDGWSTGTGLAHLAFWDRLTLLRWQEAADTGRDAPLGLGQPLYDLINDALVAEWSALDAAVVRRLVAGAAADLDAHIATLSDERVGAVIDAGQRRLVDRGIHRELHLGPIEATLADA
jgi:hypothetical protein